MRELYKGEDLLYPNRAAERSRKDFEQDNRELSVSIETLKEAARTSVYYDLNRNCGRDPRKDQLITYVMENLMENEAFYEYASKYIGEKEG